MASLLFNIFINYIHIVNSNLFIFVDTKLFCIIRTQLDTEVLQDDLDRMSNWCNTNKMNLNVSKCKIIIFSIKRFSIFKKYTLNGIELDRVPKSYRLLS